MRGKIKPLSLHPQSRNKRWFEKVTIAKQNDLVAQLVEQMTLNHWVESSSLSGVTKQSLKSGCFFYFCRPQAVAYLQHASARTGLWKSVVAPRRWTYRCGTVLSMSIKWRGQPPKGGCINQGKYFCKKFCIGDFGKVESAESQSSWRSRRTFPQHLSTTALRVF